MNRTTIIRIALCCLPGFQAASAQHPMTIDELFQQVDRGSKSVKAQQASIEVARHGIEEAKSQRLPDVDAQLAVSYNGNVLMTDRDFSNATGFSQPHLGNSFSLQARQVIYAGGTINAGIRMAELQHQQATTGLQLTRNQQRMLALGQYLDLYRIANSIRVYEQNIALTERLIDDIKAKQQQGMALRNDVTRYELQMEQLRLGLRRMQDSRTVANHQLCNTLGLADTDIQPDTTLISAVFAKDGEQAWQQRAEAASPLIRQSETSMLMAEQGIKLAKSELLPKVAVVAADNFAGPYTYDIPPIDNNFNIWYVGVGVKYSLSSLFKSNKSVRRAKASLEQSRENHAVAAEQVNNQMQEAYTLYEQSYVNLRTQQKSTELARQNYQVVNDRYLNQLALITDMVDASNMRLNAELQEVDARIGIVYAYYRLKFIAGEI